MTLSTTELNNLGIRQWDNLKGKYEKLDILLGNGFSINFSPNFMYRSIYEKFQQHCDPLQKELFSQFNTTNFEEIMLMLTYTKKVNTVFGLSTSEVEGGVEALKNGLIASINELHPRTDTVPWPVISSISRQFIEDFSDIYSLNYDLLLYHIIMAAYDAWRDDHSLTSLQDFCWGKIEGTKYYREFKDFQGLGGYNDIYYIHGNLCLFNSKSHVVKLIRGDRGAELIDLISERISTGYFPLFVSEGTYEEKRARVLSNQYLHFCFDKLGAARKPLMIFGLTLAPNDEHIIQQIKSNPRPLIISIYPENRSALELKKEVTDQMMKFGNYFKPEIDFVDSRSVFQFI